MDEVIRKIGELHDLLVKKIADNNALEDKIREAQESQERVGQTQADEQAELVEREQAVSSIENVKAMREEAIATQEKNRKEKEEIAELRSSLASTQQEISNDKASVRGREINLADGQKKLEEEKKVYKEQIKKEILNGLLGTAEKIK